MTVRKGYGPAMVVMGVLCLSASIVAGSGTPVSEPKIAILKDSFAPEYGERALLILRSLTDAGLRATFVCGDELSDERAFSTERFDCLILPDARLFPAKALPNFFTFLRSGGDLVVIGGPIFDKLLYRASGRWQTKDQVLGSVRPSKIALDLSALRGEPWVRASSNPDAKGKLVITRAVGLEGEAWAEFSVEHLAGWDTYRIELPMDAFPKGHSLVCFQAFGDKNTLSMALEIEEEDGSRWIAVVPLEEAARRYALPVEEFKYWRDSTSRGRGGRGDKLDLSNARFLSIGLARSHNNLPANGPHSFSISSIGSASSPPMKEVTIPVLETLYPWYKTYVTEKIEEIVKAAPSSLAHLTIEGGETEIVCPIWRSRGLGFRNRLAYRWVPIANGYDDRGRFRGTVVSMTLNFEGEFRNSHWLQIGFRDGRVISELSDVLGGLMAECIRKMHRNVFLRGGGASRASYFEGEDVVVGCVLNSAPPPPYRARIRAGKPDRPRWPGVVDETMRFPPEGEASLSWKARAWGSAYYNTTTEVLDGGGDVTDRLTQSFTMPRDAPVPAEEIVRVEGSHFILRGRRWYPHGMNYWPSNWGGREGGEFWQHWLSPGLYDPVIVERDLALARELKINSLSIQLNRPEQVPAVNDFLLRCRRHGIYVNLFLAGAHPLHPNLRLVSTFLREGRFAANPAIYAYDIAWEPHVGAEAERKRLDPEWAKWIEERYVGIENAEKDWKFELRKENGGITTPSQHQILNPGPWNVMVAAYRRFLDDLISRGYREVTRRIREIDPTHLIGARSGYGGTGEPWIDPRMPFDLISGAKHLDFISPEGYGLSPDWERARAAGFTTLYGRYAGNGKPVFWAEFGQSVHPSYDEVALTRQKNIYESMYRLVLDSFAQGSAGWWFPGGYRLGENSDYGIIWPDMTLRPSAQTLARYSPAIAAQRPVPAPDVWITIDRDLHPRGYSQIRKRHEAEYIRFRREGKTVALQTAATGTTSATVPDVAVGNVPYTGRNPHKYLNAEFNRVQVVLRNGKRTDVRKGATIAIGKGEPLRLAVSVGNTGEPTWLAPRRDRFSKGDVYLLCLIGSASQHLPIRQNVERYQDYEFRDLAISPGLSTPVRVIMWMEAFRKASFGEKFEFTLSPE